MKTVEDYEASIKVCISEIEWRSHWVNCLKTLPMEREMMFRLHWEMNVYVRGLKYLVGKLKELNSILFINKESPIL